MPPAAPPHPRCVLREGLHLFSPQAAHHAALADAGADATSSGANTAQTKLTSHHDINYVLGVDDPATCLEAATICLYMAP